MPIATASPPYPQILREDSGNHKHIIYKYLLLATRLDMNENRQHGGIDGTHLLEELASQAAREYFGSRAESIVFGTASSDGDFPRKVDDLCKRIQEGVRFHNRRGNRRNIRDGKLDVVAWNPFSDRLSGKLIGFGQCKTGTNYRDTLTQLQPDTFCTNWLYSPPALSPTRMFFVAEALSRLDWDSVSSEAGLLLDRCRIVDFCDDINAGVLDKVKRWTEAAARGNQLPV